MADKTPQERSSERAEILRKFEAGEITHHDAAIALAKTGFRHPNTRAFLWDALAAMHIQKVKEEANAKAAADSE